MTSQQRAQSACTDRQESTRKTSKIEWLYTKEMPEYTGLSASFFEKLRIYGGGPIFYRFGRKILYKIQDVDLWLEARRCEPEGGRDV